MVFPCLSPQVSYNTQYVVVTGSLIVSHIVSHIVSTFSNIVLYVIVCPYTLIQSICMCSNAVGALQCGAIQSLRCTEHFCCSLHSSLKNSEEQGLLFFILALILLKDGSIQEGWPLSLSSFSSCSHSPFPLSSPPPPLYLESLFKVLRHVGITNG